MVLDIPAQSLNAALQALASQTGMQLVYETELATGLRSASVQGELSAREALERLLEGTGLRFQFLDERTAAVSAGPPGARADAGGSGGIRLAQAGQSSSDSGPGDVGAIQIQEIIVTAQKREQSLQDVPVSVAVASGEQIEAQGVRNLEELSGHLPNIRIAQGPSSDQLHIRGVGSGFNQGFEQAVAIFVDGLYRGRSRATRAALFDVERVEVLRGPQSTFFGNNAIAGALNITTRKPGRSFEANAGAHYAPEDGEYNIEAGISVPVTDTLRARVAGRLAGMDGYIENPARNRDAPNSTDRLGRIVLVWTPSDVLDATFRADVVSHDADGAFAYELLNCPPAPEYPFPGNPLNGCNLYRGASGEIDDRLDYRSALNETFANLRSEEGGLTLNLNVAGHVLTSVTGYSSMEYEQLHDVDAVPLESPVVPGAVRYPYAGTEEHEQWSQELRLASNRGGRFEYMAGLYYQHGRLRAGNTLGFYFAPFGSFAPEYFEPTDAIALSFPSRQDEATYSVFAALNFDLTDRLRLNLGGRYTEVDKKAWRSAMIGTADGFALPGSFVPGPAEGQAVLSGVLGVQLFDLELSRSDSDFMPSASLELRATDDVMLYASYSDGFKAGGFSMSDFILTPARFTFGPETVDAFELGMKAVWLDGRLTANLALFRSEYSDLQQAVGQIRDNIVVIQVANVASSISQGVELDASWRVTNRLRLGASLAFLDSEFDSYPNAGCTALQTVGDPNCVQDLSGRPTPFAPEYSGSVNAEYRAPLTAGLDLSLGGEVYFSGAYYTQADLDPSIRQNAYAKLNARIAVGASSGAWEVAVVGKNLNDETTVSFCNDVPQSVGTFICLPDRPRSVALQGRVRW